jgi:hypothetical protein
VQRAGCVAERLIRLARTAPSEKETTNQKLDKKIKDVYEKSHGTYGNPRVYPALRREGVTCSENRVARLLPLCDVQAGQTRTCKPTIMRSNARPLAPNRLNREFVAEPIPVAPDEAVVVPDTPGLGIQLDADKLARSGEKYFDITSRGIAVKTVRERGLLSALRLARRQRR